MPRKYQYEHFKCVFCLNLSYSICKTLVFQWQYLSQLAIYTPLPKVFERLGKILGLIFTNAMLAKKKDQILAAKQIDGVRK